MQNNEDYVLGVLRDGGLLTRKQIDGARSRLNGEPGVLDVLIDNGALSEVDVSRTLAAQAHMARFNYVALDARGQEASGLLEATSSSAAISQLRQAGYFPTSVIEEALIRSDGKEAGRRAAKAAGGTKQRAKKGIVLFQRRKVKSKVLMIFTRQLATLIDSGLPLLRSLNVLAKQERDKVLKNTIDKLADSVQSGSTFSDALALHPKIFNDLYVNMRQLQSFVVDPLVSTVKQIDIDRSRSVLWMIRFAAHRFLDPNQLLE